MALKRKRKVTSPIRCLFWLACLGCDNWEFIKVGYKFLSVVVVFSLIKTVIGWKSFRGARRDNVETEICTFFHGRGGGIWVTGNMNHKLKKRMEMEFRPERALTNKIPLPPPLHFRLQNPLSFAVFCFLFPFKVPVNQFLKLYQTATTITLQRWRIQQS